MTKVIVLRGIPGSGKSTFASREYPGATVCSADHFFVDESGEYRFVPAKIGEAHGACMRRFIESVQAGAEVVVVDNTNTTVAEVAPYVAVGQAYGAEVEIISIRCDVETGSNRNVHGVPREAVAAMAKRLESETGRLAPWWNHRWVGSGGQ